MKLLKKLKEQENGSITMTVIALMLFVTGSILIAYFSLSNQSKNQSKKIKQISDSYKVTNRQVIEKYKEVYDDFILNLNYSNGLGDVDNNNVINSYDVEAINAHINNLNILEGVSKVRADINKDKNINSEDVRLLQEKIDEDNNT